VIRPQISTESPSSIRITAPDDRSELVDKRHVNARIEDGDPPSRDSQE